MLPENWPDFTKTLSTALRDLRAGSPDVMKTFSSMAQAGGYLLAAPGPLLIGWFQAVTDSWNYSFGAIVILAMMTATFGYFAGRGGTVHLLDQEASTGVLGIPAPGKEGED